jgi:hypothetical protein
MSKSTKNPPSHNPTSTNASNTNNSTGTINAHFTPLSQQAPTQSQRTITQRSTQPPQQQATASPHEHRHNHNNNPSQPETRASPQGTTGTRYSTRIQETSTTKKSRTELIRDSQSSIKDKDSARKWLLKHELIIPGEETSEMSPSLALLYLANGKYEAKASIDGMRAIAIFFDGKQQTQVSDKTSRELIQDIETNLETVTNKYIKVIESTMDKFTENYGHKNTSEPTTPNTNIATNDLDNTNDVNPGRTTTTTTTASESRNFTTAEATEFLRSSELITQEETATNPTLTQTLL